MVETYVGKTCPYCQTPIKAGVPVVVCPECHMPHHQECWQDNHGCTTLGCPAHLTVDPAPSISAIPLDPATPLPETATGVRVGMVGLLAAAALLLGLAIGLLLPMPSRDRAVYRRGYTAGHAQGYTEGQNDGYHSGYSDGKRDGYQRGYLEGRLEGLRENLLPLLEDGTLPAEPAPATPDTGISPMLPPDPVLPNN